MRLGALSRPFTMTIQPPREKRGLGVLMKTIPCDQTVTQEVTSFSAMGEISIFNPKFQFQTIMILESTEILQFFSTPEILKCNDVNYSSTIFTSRSPRVQVKPPLNIHSPAHKALCGGAECPVSAPGPAALSLPHPSSSRTLTPRASIKN